MLQFMGLLRVRHDLVTEQQQPLHAGFFITDIMGDTEQERHCPVLTKYTL